jgi:hypothetical protein
VGIEKVRGSQLIPQKWVYELFVGADYELKQSIVMLSAAKHLSAHRERPFVAAQGDMDEENGVTL